jgi:hypothetical protein
VVMSFPMVVCSPLFLIQQVVAVAACHGLDDYRNY